MYARFFKRLLDLAASLAALVLISPALAALTAWLHFANRGAGAFFYQERAGKNEKTFKLIKFKTMTDERDSQGSLLPSSERVTPGGRFLRRASLDELPQLINVVKGDMSLVGPRPLLLDYLPLYSPRQRRRHAVRPGITGWAQVNGRNAISWDEKFELDVWYVEHLSLWLDIKIMLMTIKKLLQAGMAPEEHTLMPRFTGSDKP